MNCKNESVTSVKFGSSTGASNATQLSASGGFAPPLDPPPEALPLHLRWELHPQTPIGSCSRVLAMTGAQLPHKRNILASRLVVKDNLNVFL